MNRWSLEELVKRDPENFLILLQQIIIKTKEVQEQCQYELVVPLAIMFSSTLLQTPHCPPNTELLEEAVEVFRCFLTWPEPYCSVCKNLLSTLQLEIKAPGISFQRLVRQEQGLNTSSQCSQTLTVLLMNPGEVPADFLSVAEQLSHVKHSQRETYMNLIKHAFQSALGTKYPLHSIHKALQGKTTDELRDIFSVVSDVLETAADASDPLKGRGHVIQGLEGLRERMRIPVSNGRKSDGMLQTLPLPTANCYMFHWEKDNFDVLNSLLEHGPDDLTANGQSEEEEEVDINGEDDEDDDEDLTEMDAEDEVEDEEDKEEEDHGVELPSMTIIPNGYSSNHRASTFSTISSLSTASKDSMFSTLSVTSESYAQSLFSVTSGADSDYCEDSDDYLCSSPVMEKCSPRSTKASVRLSQHFYKFFSKSPRSLCRAKSLGNTESKDLLLVREKRSNSLPQQVRLLSPELLPQPQSQTLRHVCFRRRPILSSDEDNKNTTLRVVVFGADHVAGKVVISGRSQWKRETKVCTSVNLTKACKNPEELEMIFLISALRGDEVFNVRCVTVQQTLSDSKMECLQLMMTEVLKRQNAKSKKGFNQQLNVMEVKVDKVQVSGAGNTTFAVCLDQDEKKILQTVTRSTHMDIEDHGTFLHLLTRPDYVTMAESGHYAS
ncbi:hypothetical protein F2P81_010436 [Scophthalmus maximus]|uniref:Phosphoinositide 3-kinase regulatory subunit 5 n=1 Tax=Scophthalmus maximus TaxID=52904 RepID=A0A6A4T5S7_SCOMX|nr:hypothetical protein F2P81_010436 [Scophthalmus maximus]